jgi:hypothetical protein
MPRNEGTQDMNEPAKTVNDSSCDHDRADDILACEVSDEELEAAANPAVTYNTAGGWLSSTPQCCSFGSC